MSGARDTSQSISRFRGTWNPVWMDDNSWLNKFKVEAYMDMFREHIAEDEAADQEGDDEERQVVRGSMILHPKKRDDDADEDDDEERLKKNKDAGDAPRDEDQSLVSSSSSLSLDMCEDDDDDDEDGTERLLEMFGFAARAVIQPSPWANPPLGKQERRTLLGVLLRRFLDRTANPLLLSKRIKQLLKDMRSDDVATDLFCHYVSYMSGTPWEQKAVLRPSETQQNNTQVTKPSFFGGLRSSVATKRQSVALLHVDVYRSQHNFYGNADLLKEFRDACDKKVEENLHLIQQDVSRSEAKATRAIDYWHRLRKPDSDRGCFGNHLTVDLRELVLDANDILKQVAYQGPNEPLDDVVLEVNSKTLVRRTRKLPRNVDVSVAIVFDGCVDVMLELRGVNAQPLQLDGGQKLSWPKTQPISFFLGHGGRAVDRAWLLIQVRRRGFMCGLREGTLLAEFTVPLFGPLYTNILRFDDPLRDELGPNVGVHAQRVRTSDVIRGVAATMDISMQCLDSMHNERPPPINVELEEERRQRVIQARRDDVWRVDHHALFKSLADTLGELDNDAFQILDFYADRYLIHSELKETVMLVSAAMQSDFSKDEDREIMESALRSIMGMRGSVTTRICGKLMDQALSTLRTQAIERLVNLESMVPSSASGGDAFSKTRTVLFLTGVSANDFPVVIAKRCKELVQPAMRKFVKLARYIPMNLMIGVAGATAGAMSRMSVLPELEECGGDRRDLIVKARVLVNLVDQFVSPLLVALQFAQEAKHGGVTALVACRIEASLADFFDPLESCNNALIACMLSSNSDANPLSDSCGMMMAVYERVMQVVDGIMALQITSLDEQCLRFMRLLDPFFPLWFHLCRAKQPSWVTMFVEHEPLEPVAPGKIFYNHTPADAQNVVDSLLLVFLKALRWADPAMAAININNFSKVIANFTEELCGALLTKLQKAHNLPEKVVGLCTYCRLCEMLEETWSSTIEGSLIQVEFKPGQLPPELPAGARASSVQQSGGDAAQLIASSRARLGSLRNSSNNNNNNRRRNPSAAAEPEEGSPEMQVDMLRAQCAATKAGTLGIIVANIDVILADIARLVRKNFLEALQLRMATADEGGFTSAFAEENMKELQHDLRYDLSDSIGVALPSPSIKANVDEGGKGSPSRDIRGSMVKKHGDLATVTSELRERCVKAVYDAFRDFAMSFATTTISPSRKLQFMNIVESIEDVIRDVWNPKDPINKYMDEGFLVTHSHRARAIVLWLCHTSGQLIHVLSAGDVNANHGSPLNPADEMMLATVKRSGEYELLRTIISLREDKEAKKFVKTQF